MKVGQPKWSFACTTKMEDSTVLEYILLWSRARFIISTFDMALAFRKLGATDSYLLVDESGQ